jgi:uracil-DNA glycosylase
VASGVRPNWQALDEHLARLDACRLCPTVVPPPVLGRPEIWPRMLLVGQAPGPREVVARVPFAYTAGQRLFAWFARLGVTEAEFRARVRMVAVIRCFPGRAPKGGDRPPSPKEIATCAPHLERELDILQPATVIAVGKNAIEWFLGKSAPLETRIGRSFPIERQGLSLDVVPLPHPSGRSTWLVKPENQRLLEKALEVLRDSTGWRETFGEGS